MAVTCVLKRQVQIRYPCFLPRLDKLLHTRKKLTKIFLSVRVAEGDAFNLHDFDPECVLAE